MSTNDTNIILIDLYLSVVMITSAGQQIASFKHVIVIRFEIKKTIKDMYERCVETPA